MNIENPFLRDIFFFGDSITYGEWDAAGGWVQRLRQVADKDFIRGEGAKTHFYNLGITGHTSAQLLQRMESEIAARFNPAAATQIVIAIGMNDAHYMMAEGRFCATPEEFVQNLKALLARARKYTEAVALVGLNPVDQGRTDPLPWNRAKAYRLSRIEEFNGVIRTTAAAEKAFFVDIWQDWISADYLPFLSDGLHPNEAGHRRIAQAVGGFLNLLPE